MPEVLNTLAVANSNPSCAQTMSSREIAELVSARHDSVKRAIERLSEREVIVQPPMVDEQDPDAIGRIRLTKVYQFSGEQGKRDSIIVVAQLCPEFTARLVDRWAELERTVKSVQPLQLSRMDLIQLALSAEQEAQAERAQRQALEVANAELQPKAAAFERIAVSDGSMCFTDAAKTLQIQPKTLLQYLDSHGWTYKRTGGRERIAYQSKLQSGLLEHKIDTVPCGVGVEKTVTRARVTAKGLARLAKIFPPTLQAA